ncbi:MAG: cyclase family protein [Thermaerobacter sp.]|nr:cyclase family protein [Thermaerobacter sp.]
MPLVDLSVPWGPDVQPLDGHPRIRFEPVTTHEREGRSNTRVEFSIHTGTHIDAPFHFFPEGKTIDQIPLAVFIGPAIAVDVTRFGSPRQAITLDNLFAAGIADVALSGIRLLLRTDWATQHWNQPDLYTKNPYLAQDAAQWLANQGIAALGLDFAVDSEFPYPNHYVFLGKEILLMENLINLDRLGSRPFTLMALPLRVVGGDGGPARVVASV